MIFPAGLHTLVYWRQLSVLSQTARALDSVSREEGGGEEKKR